MIGSAPTDSARSGVIGGGYRGAPIGRRERRGWVYPYSNPCNTWTGRLWVGNPAPILFRLTLHRRRRVFELERVGRTANLRQLFK